MASHPVQIEGRARASEVGLGMNARQRNVIWPQEKHPKLAAGIVENPRALRTPERAMTAKEGLTT